MAGVFTSTMSDAGRKPRKAVFMVAQTEPADKVAVGGLERNAWIRALARARQVARRRPCYIARLDAYHVHSDNSGNDYMVHPVEVDGHLTYHCECVAGMHGLVCWHAALVAALPVERERRRLHRSLVQDRA